MERTRYVRRQAQRLLGGRTRSLHKHGPDLKLDFSAPVPHPPSPRIRPDLPDVVRQLLLPSPGELLVRADPVRRRVPHLHPHILPAYHMALSWYDDVSSLHLRDDI